jgi:hypothetical protein
VSARKRPTARLGLKSLSSESAPGPPAWPQPHAVSTGTGNGASKFVADPAALEEPGPGGCLPGFPITVGHAAAPAHWQPEVVHLRETFEAIMPVIGPIASERSVQRSMQNPLQANSVESVCYYVQFGITFLKRVQVATYYSRLIPGPPAGPGAVKTPDLQAYTGLRALNARACCCLQRRIIMMVPLCQLDSETCRPLAGPQVGPDLGTVTRTRTRTSS